MRPWLDVERRYLLDYAQNSGLRWVEDPSNRDVKFDRNFIRGKVLPQLKEQWPDVGNHLLRVAQHVTASSEVLQHTMAGLEDQIEFARLPTNQTQAITWMRAYLASRQVFGLQIAVS